MHIYTTNSSICPVRALKLFTNKIDTRLPHLHVSSTGTLSPLDSIEANRNSLSSSLTSWSIPFKLCIA